MSRILDDATIQAILAGDLSDSFAVFGMHGGGRQSLNVTTFQPGAERVEVVAIEDGTVAGELSRLHEEGVFAGPLKDHTEPFAYRLRMHAGGHSWEADDPYRFWAILGELDLHLFTEGNHLQAYQKLGAHPARIDGVDGVTFAVWAPNASRVSVVGPFNGWDGRRHGMRLRHEAGIWEIFIPGIGEGELYKYEIKDRFGTLLALKSDPFALRSEQPPSTASVVHRLDDYAWKDGEWMGYREGCAALSAPISVYEVHLGSWRRGEDNRYLTYQEMADQLVGYVKDMGFTHIELLPVSEHPFDGSWGYQPIGLFAPTSRFGHPNDFRWFVDRCHQEGIGVIVDWVPGHFPTDPHGLVYFDGTHLFEHADPRQGRHMDWDTLIYNFGRKEVANFLMCNALFWLQQYHIDGLRVDAVASMLYLDYSRREGEWIPNKFGGRENLEAIEFMKKLNQLSFSEAPGSTTMAEESTAWPMVSRPTYLGGLGFGYKWNMGWMHDTLDYISQDPVHRRYHHDRMTFGLLYAFTENFVLPLSHDEVVHGKGSMLGKMPGDRWQKFANLRAYYGFMYTYPGKKLLFMGGEFGQEREWNHDSSLDWHLLDDPMHKGVQSVLRDLNRLYRDRPALHERDCDPEGFEWIECQDVDQSVFAYLRKGSGGAAPVVVVCNFTPVPREGYRIGVPAGGAWRQVLNTDAEHYGGSGVGSPDLIHAEDVAWHGRERSLSLRLPPLSTLVLVAEG